MYGKNVGRSLHDAKKSVAPLVCGIIGVVLCWIPIAAIVLGILAVVMVVRVAV